jgi:hypothetical protein
MTTMAVLYLRDLGQPLGAMSTTIPGDLPPLDQTSELRVGVPALASLAGPTPGPLIPHPITVEGSELAVAQLETEFDDPLEVFQWRVVETPGPGTTVERRLERLGTGRVILTGTTSGPQLLLDVPRLGSQTKLDYEVRSLAGLHLRGNLDFGGTSDARMKVPVPVPDMSDWVVLVKGYAPAAPIRLRITRGGTGPAKGTELTLRVPRREDELELDITVPAPSGPAVPDKVTFAVSDTRQVAKVTVTGNETINVTVEGYPPVTVPALP